MQQAVFEYIELDYNRARRHRTNGCISPEALELKASSLKTLTLLVAGSVGSIIFTVGEIHGDFSHRRFLRYVA